MYILNGIAYAKEPVSILKVSDIYPLENYMLQILFSTGETKIFDFKPLLNRPAFVPLMDKNIFKSVSLSHGVPTWENGNIDIAPEMLYENSSILMSI